MTPSSAEEEDAFTRYVVPELEVLYRTARSLTRDPNEAEDLVQDTLLRAYRSIDRFDGRYPRAWLLTILRNTHINRVRKKRPELLHDPEVTFERSTEFADHDDPEQAVVDATFDAVVAAALADLSPEFRQVIELVDLGGLPYQQTADRIGVPVGTVMSRLHRARRRIRDAIGEHGLDRDMPFLDPPGDRSGVNPGDDSRGGEIQ